MQHLSSNELGEGRHDELHHIMSDIRNDYLPSTPKRPNQLLGELLGTCTSKVWRFTVDLGVNLSQMNVHERNGLVVWGIESFVGVKAQSDSAIEVFGGGVENDSGHGRFVGEGSDEYDECWASAGSRAEGRQKSPSQEQREEGVDADLFHVFFLIPFVEAMVHE